MSVFKCKRNYSPSNLNSTEETEVHKGEVGFSRSYSYLAADKEFELKSPDRSPYNVRPDLTQHVSHGETISIDKHD